MRMLPDGVVVESVGRGTCGAAAGYRERVDVDRALGQVGGRVSSRGGRCGLRNADVDRGRSIIESATGRIGGRADVDRAGAGEANAGIAGVGMCLLRNAGV